MLISNQQSPSTQVRILYIPRVPPRFNAYLLYFVLNYAKMYIMKEEILRLRSQGYSYNQIVAELKCSKGTVSYYCGEGQREKTTHRTKVRRADDALIKKTAEFKYHRNKTYEDQTVYDFNVQDVKNKIGANPVCYMTGRAIDLTDSSSYHLDHRVSRAKGGGNSLDNLEIACKDANFAKRDMSYEEFVDLCRDVVRYHDKEI